MIANWPPVRAGRLAGALVYFDGPKSTMQLSRPARLVPGLSIDSTGSPIQAPPLGQSFTSSASSGDDTCHRPISDDASAARANSNVGRPNRVAADDMAVRLRPTRNPGSRRSRRQLRGVY